MHAATPAGRPLIALSGVTIGHGRTAVLQSIDVEIRAGLLRVRLKITR